MEIVGVESGRFEAGRRMRPIVVCLFRRGDQILVIEVPDTVKGIVGYRPLGGGIEHGGGAVAEAVRREIREELGIEMSGLTHLGVTESIFTYMGKLGHEIVFVYEANAAQPRIYEIGIPDLLISAIAERESLTVLHYDGDYDFVAQVTGQPMQWVVPRGSVP